ncbi:MAG: hypothetical protein K2X87_13040, partial [Gemmataceae bacterium]|nr:hypothetical protein [Gemmataceae bacterium]
MADGRDHSTGVSFRATFPWMSLFRCFQVALDPRKLLVAAAGILLMSLGWYVLSAIFYYPAPQRNDPRYANSAIQREYENRTKPGTADRYTEEDITRVGDERFAADTDQWKVMADLAGPYPSAPGQAPPGRFRAMPWDEYRGPNPFLLVTRVVSGSAEERRELVGGFLSGSVPVLVEPLVKFLVPVGKLISPGVSFQTRVYLFLLVLWALVVWGFAGGVITRLAAVQLADKGPMSLRQAVRFVARRYANYLLSPLVPLGIIAAVAVGLFLYGLVALIPVVGDLLLLGLLLPLVILGGAIMAVFLVGLVGYPLMYPTLSAEGDSSDTFDALSRSVNYVYQAPWHYAWYWLVAVLYGAAVTFFVLFFTSLMVYMGKWAVGLPASAVYSDRKPDYLFIYAPESFGWRELLLQDSPYAITHEQARTPTGRPVDVYQKVNPAQYDAARGEFYAYNTWGAGIVAFWLALIFLMMLGFSYSFFWSAATAIYFLMRKKVDEADPDEVFLEDDEPEVPTAPPKAADAAAAPAGPPVQATLPVLV